MIQHLIKCEMCNQQFEFGKMERPIEHLAPEGWLMLSQMKDMAAHEGWHFCSMGCLFQFAHNEVAKPIGTTDDSPYIRREEGV